MFCPVCSKADTTRGRPESKDVFCKLWCKRWVLQGLGKPICQHLSSPQLWDHLQPSGFFLIRPCQSLSIPVPSSYRWRSNLIRMSPSHSPAWVRIAKSCMSTSGATFSCPPAPRTRMKHSTRTCSTSWPAARSEQSRPAGPTQRAGLPGRWVNSLHHVYIPGWQHIFTTGHPDPRLISSTLPSTSLSSLCPLLPPVEGASVHLFCNAGRERGHCSALL